MQSIIEMAETRHGRMVVLSQDTYISRSLIEYGEWTEVEFSAMAQALKPGDNVIDVGANLGALTLAFARRVGADGMVYAFEPQPRIFQLLATNATINGLLNARLFNAGCGAEAGGVEIAEIAYAKPFNYGALALGDLREAAAALRLQAQGGMKRVAPIVRIDDVYEHPSCKLIKIDVEGMEADVLRGARRVISEFRPVLYVENEFPERSPELIGLLADLNYDAWWHIAPCFNPENARGRKDDIFGGAACVNMLCAPAEKAANISGLQRIASIDEHPRKAA